MLLFLHKYCIPFLRIVFAIPKTIDYNILWITVCVSFYKLSTRHSKQKTYDWFLCWRCKDHDDICNGYWEAQQLWGMNNLWEHEWLKRCHCAFLPVACSVSGSGTADVLVIVDNPALLILDFYLCCTWLKLWQARVQEPKEAQEWQTWEESWEEAERWSEWQGQEEGQEWLPSQEPSQEPKETQEPSLSIEQPRNVIIKCAS